MQGTEVQQISVKECSLNPRTHACMCIYMHICISKYPYTHIPIQIYIYMYNIYLYDYIDYMSVYTFIIVTYVCICMHVFAHHEIPTAGPFGSGSLSLAYGRSPTGFGGLALVQESSPGSRLQSSWQTLRPKPQTGVRGEGLQPCKTPCS